MEVREPVEFSRKAGDASTAAGALVSPRHVPTVWKFEGKHVASSSTDGSRDTTRPVRTSFCTFFPKRRKKVSRRCIRARILVFQELLHCTGHQPQSNPFLFPLLTISHTRDCGRGWASPQRRSSLSQLFSSPSSSPPHHSTFNSDQSVDGTI